MKKFLDPSPTGSQGPCLVLATRSKEAGLPEGHIRVKVREVVNGSQPKNRWLVLPLSVYTQRLRFENQLSTAPST